MSLLINLDDAPEHVEFHGDICIVGAGAAGITLAMELRSTGKKIILIDGGGLGYSEDSQSLYRMQRSVWYPDPTMSRVRFFGGSTNHWEGSCRTFDPIDFERRSWVPDSGWPISYRDLELYYDRAFPYMELGPRYVDESPFASQIGAYNRKLAAAGLTVRLTYSSPPTAFGTMYLDPLRHARNVTIVTRGNLKSIDEAADRQSVRSVTLINYRRRTTVVKAKYYVIALGGIENPRALLMSDAVSPGGIGNEHDVVGRYFMDHPVIDACVFYPTQDFIRAWDKGTKKRDLVLQASQDTLRRHGLTNARMPLQRSPRAETSDGIESAHQLEKAIAKHKGLHHILHHLGSILGDSDVLVEQWLHKKGYSTGDKYSSEYGGYASQMMMEQRPNRDNRIVLTADRDSLGLRKGKILWQLPQSEKNDFKRLVDEVARGLGAQGIAVTHTSIDYDDTDRCFEELMNFGHHHMGTTRASADPRKGVVDGDQRIHGRKNIYIAGSSVFPTGSHVTPTTTIVAMTIRLADHLRKKA